jgi:hypothetical protein
MPIYRVDLVNAVLRDPSLPMRLKVQIALKQSLTMPISRGQI